MPRPAHNRQTKKKPEPFSGVFYQKIARTSVEESGTDHGRRALTWLGAAAVMAVLVTMWATSLPARLSRSFGNSPLGLGRQIFDQKVASSPADLWRTTTERLNDFKNLATAVASLKSAEASSTAPPQLTARQIEKLKTKLANQ